MHRPIEQNLEPRNRLRKQIWMIFDKGEKGIQCKEGVFSVYLILWHPMDCSLPDSSVPGIFQARILEWVAISYSRESSWPKDQIHISCISCTGRQILYHCTTWEANLFKKGYWASEGKKQKKESQLRLTVYANLFLGGPQTEV